MKRLLTHLVIAAIVITSLPQVASAAFTDVGQSHKNYEAITYLEQAEILNGYSDNTFRPETTINRAEFLKIVIEGTDGVTTDITKPTPFTDINPSAWYMPYVKKAYHEGWVVGYEDKTFRPEQTITKAESLKIIGEIQGWEVKTYITVQPFADVYKTAWFTPYIDFAKHYNMLQEANDENFYPNSQNTRANTSEVIFRSIPPSCTLCNDNDDDDDDDDNNDDNDDDTAPIQDDTETPDETMAQDEFDNIWLYDNPPLTYYEDEVYVFEGSISGIGNYNFVTVILDENTGSNYDTFTGGTDQSGNFSIPVYFDNDGDFYIGIIPGENGSTDAIEIEVKNSLPSSTETEEKPNIASFSINFEDDTTSIEHTAPNSSIKKVRISQGSKNVTYINRQNRSGIPIRYSDFNKFSEKSTNYYVQAAKTTSSSPLEISSDFEITDEQSFDAAIHTFSTILENDVTTPNIPSTLSSASRFSFSGTLEVNIKTTGYVIREDGFVNEIELALSGETGTYYGSETLKSGGTFGFTYTPPDNGRYIVEVNDQDGIAIINHPIYIGGSIPLIPDYFDTHTRDYFEGSVSLSSNRNTILDYINDDRQDHGLSSIDLSSELNTLAQNHSEDMADNNFFSHINQSGQSPNDRRIAIGIATPVSENIAKDVSLRFAHEGLMRSAAHRTNILDKSWDRVGIGIVEDNGYLIITEEFSTDDITTSDLANYKSELFEEINNARTVPLAVDTAIEDAATYLNNESIISETELTNDTLSEALDLHYITGDTVAFFRNYPTWTTILDSILADSSVLESTWSLTGIDVQLDQAGNIQTIIILNQP